MDKFHTYIRLDMSHADWRAISRHEYAQVSVSNQFVEEIAGRHLLPKATKIFTNWGWVLIGYVGAAIVFSALLSWWFLIGLLLIPSINAARFDETRNAIKQAAWEDERFYEETRMIGAWWFEVHTTEVNKFEAYFVGPDRMQRDFEIKIQRDRKSEEPV